MGSAYRTVTHNQNEGGKPKSYHLSGTSADIRESKNRKHVMELADIAICRCRPLFQQKGYEIGLGLAKTYLHVDMRKQFATWTYADSQKPEKNANEWKTYVTSKQCGSGQATQTEQQSVQPSGCPNPLYICPVVKGCYVTSPFNPNRLHPIHKTIRPHRGTDLRARVNNNVGDQIRAVADGKIVAEGTSLTKGYGLYWTILHNDGSQTLYAHLSKKSEGLKIGSSVKRGDIIGLSGTTGTSTAPHLHFEYWPSSVKKENGNQQNAIDCIAKSGPGTGVYPNGRPYP